MKLLISGAAGQLGRATADILLGSIEPQDLILTTRSPGSLSEYAARGVDVREADFGVPESLVPAFHGADRMLLISTDAIGRRTAQHAAAIEAARASGVARIAYTSFPIPVTPVDPLAAEHAATEALLKASGMQWSILRNFPYAEGLIDSLRIALDSGEFVSNTADGRTAWVARRDCAAAAAAVLTEDAPSGAVYDITGPEAIDAIELAALFSEIGGKPVRTRLVDDETLARGVSEATGMPLPVALGMAESIGGATRGGLYASTSDAVERLTGRAPTPLRDVLAAALRA